MRGVVEKIIERPTQRGTFYSFKIGEDWIGTGKVRPSCNEGDNIECNFKVNNKGYKELDGAITLLPPTPMSDGGGGGNNGGDRQLMISYQAARRDAVSIVTLAHQLGLSLPLAENGTGKNKGADFDSLLACVETVTGQLMAKTFDIETLGFYADGDEDMAPNPDASSGAFSE